MFVTLSLFSRLVYSVRPSSDMCSPEPEFLGQNCGHNKLIIVFPGALYTVHTVIIALTASCKSSFLNFTGDSAFPKARAVLDSSWYLWALEC